MEALLKPFTFIEVIKLSDNGKKKITGVVAVDFNEVLEKDIEWLNEEVSYKLIGDPMYLTDISWKVVGANSEGEVLLEITGDVNEFLTEKYDEMMEGE